MITLRKDGEAVEKKGYGMWVYEDLLNKGLYALDVLVISYLIHLEKYSPKFEPNNRYLMNYFHIRYNTLQEVMDRLIEKGFLCYDKEENSIYLDKDAINYIMGFDVF